MTWYKPRDDDEEEDERRKGETRLGKIAPGRGQKRKGKDNSTEDGGGGSVKSVIFCPYTVKGELAKQLRQEEENLMKLTGYKLKVVEQVGDKILDKLHTANPWRGRPCGREDCWPCNIKAWTETDGKKDCTKRSLIYETWCQTCFEKDKEAVEEEFEDEKERKLMIDRIKKHKYIGETARSAYERGWEHQDALRKLQEDSHLLKHVAHYHQGVPMEEIKFGMRVKRYARSALERQILESVMIQEERKNHQMQSAKAHSEVRDERI